MSASQPVSALARPARAHLLDSLRELRSKYDQGQMAFVLGYLGALLHSGIIGVPEYCRLSDLAKNAQQNARGEA